MKSQILKRLALSAKNRMIRKESERGKIKKRDILCSPNIRFKVVSGEDSFFVERAKCVCEEDGINPLSKLMDVDILSQLDSYGKEKYLFDTIDKYVKFKEKFEKENRRVLV